MIDFEMLRKYKDGKIIDSEDEYRLKTLSSVGMVHLGSHVEVNEDDGKIRILPTARLTNLGKKVMRLE